MINEYPSNPKKLREYNILKYNGVPPSWELIESIVEKSRLRFLYRFELVFGITRESLKKYKSGTRGLSAKHWHIFYDFENINYNRKNKLSIKMVTKTPTDLVTILRSNKNILNGIKQNSYAAG